MNGVQVTGQKQKAGHSRQVYIHLFSLGSLLHLMGNGALKDARQQKLGKYQKYYYYRYENFYYFAQNIT